MPWFGRRRRESGPVLGPGGIGPGSGGVGPGPGGDPGFSGLTMTDGWQMVLGRPFGGHLDDAVHEVSRVMYGAARYLDRPDPVGSTRFTDVYSTSIDGRDVTVANALTSVDPGLFQAGRATPSAAVCVAELPLVLPLVWIRPHRFGGLVNVAKVKTGNPDFDDRFQVIGTPAPLASVTGWPARRTCSLPNYSR